MSTPQYLAGSSYITRKLKRFDQIIKSHKDKRNYRGLLLENELKCLLISDPLTERSAASMDVNVGCMLDPKKLPGLAHFLEHMLFMGSKKYPAENTFRKFVKDHAGSTNAYTANDNTNYHFEIATGHFKEALDIFAQFFIAPTFHESTKDREINAVNSEFQKNLQDDLRRIDQLDKSTSREDHSYNKFGTGNKQTLKTEPEYLNINVRDELLDFHSKYYSANLMQLCLLGNESLDQLEQYAIEMFSNIANKNLSKVDFPIDPYKRDVPAYILYVNPVQALRRLIISWVTPDLRENYRSNPSKYLCHLINQKAQGSLIHELKRRGWSNDLNAHPQRIARGFQFFKLTLFLTEKGHENIEEILKLVYQYLNMLKKERPRKWIFDEINDLGRIHFSFKDKENPISYVSYLASTMQIYDINDILAAEYFMLEYSPNTIEKLLGYLTPEKMKITVVSKKYKPITDRIEKWYGTEYNIKFLKKVTLQKFNSCGLNEEAFKFPKKNPFIPSNLKLIGPNISDSIYPRLVYSTPLVRLGYKKDSKFLLPKVYLKFEIRNHLVNYDPTHVNMANLFVQLLQDSLSGYSYQANLAGLNYNLFPNSQGLYLSISGFNDKIQMLLNDVLENMISFKVDPQRFILIKEKYKLSLMNYESIQPYQLSEDFMKLLLVGEKGWTKKQLLDAINHFTFKSLQIFINNLLSQNNFIESFM